jgi:antitoxin HicB
MPYNQEVMSLATRTTKGGAHLPQYHYTAVFEPAAEGGYIVSVPALPGLVTEGDTIEEARAMVKDAIRGYIESLVKHGEEIPIESGTANVERVEITI